jgi:phosphonopyruvate decarboxylase
MISPAFLYRELCVRGIGFFTGVPDSLLKHFCAYIRDAAPPAAHVTAVNEGAAVGLAAGHYLATGKTALVYMQNSGIGNAVNPLLSLCDKDVYRVPMLLLIGWRGEAGVHDEPQHITQGRLTPSLLETLGVPYFVIADTEAALSVQLDAAFAALREKGSPVALVVRKDTFAPYKAASQSPSAQGMTREEAIEEIILSSPQDFFFSTTGMASRELYELRKKHGMGGERDFLTVGSMGHTASIALGAALAKPGAPVTCLDGDGAALMHLGALAAIGASGAPLLRHIVLNNGAHDSVGGQPTIAFDIDLCAIARAAGYKKVFYADGRAALRLALDAEKDGGRDGPVFIEARVRRGARANLGRPKTAPFENKAAFMKQFSRFEGEGL